MLNLYLSLGAVFNVSLCAYAKFTFKMLQKKVFFCHKHSWISLEVSLKISRGVTLTKTEALRVLVFLG